MTFGVNIKNSSGFIQIDDTYSSYCINESGSVVLTPGGNPSVSVNGFGRTPLIFLRASNSQTVICEGIGTTSFRLLAPSSNTANVTVEWFSAVPSYLVSVTGSFGLKVLDASGVVTFDSRRAYMRVRQAQAVTAGVTTENTYTVAAMPSGGRPYYLANMFAGRIGIRVTAVIPSGKYTEGWAGIRQISNTSFGIKRQEIGTFDGTVADHSFSGNFQLVTCDAPVAA